MPYIFWLCSSARGCTPDAGQQLNATYQIKQKLANISTTCAGKMKARYPKSPIKYTSVFFLIVFFSWCLLGLKISRLAIILFSWEKHGKFNQVVATRLSFSRMLWMLFLSDIAMNFSNKEKCKTWKMVIKYFSAKSRSVVADVVRSPNLSGFIYS